MQLNAAMIAGIVFNLIHMELWFKELQQSVNYAVLESQLNEMKIVLARIDERQTRYIGKTKF